MSTRIKLVLSSLLTLTCFSTACDVDDGGRVGTDDFGDDTDTDDGEFGDEFGDDGAGGDAGEAPTPGPLPGEAPDTCTIEQALGGTAGDAEILGQACHEYGNGDVDCILDVEIGAFDGTQGQVHYQLEGEFSHFRLVFDPTPDASVIEAIVAPDGSFELVNLLANHDELAVVLGHEVGDAEVEQAAIDILKLMKSTGETLPQPTKTWCEIACEANEKVLCAAAAGGAAACCVGTVGICCVAGSGIAAAACASESKCEERCDSQNL